MSESRASCLHPRVVPRYRHEEAPSKVHTDAVVYSWYECEVCGEKALFAHFNSLTAEEYNTRHGDPARE